MSAPIHLLQKPRITPRLTDLDRATCRWCSAKPSCCIILSEPWYHLQTEGQVPHYRVYQRQAVKWASREDRFLILSALSNCKQSSTDLQDDTPSGSLPRRSRADCNQEACHEPYIIRYMCACVSNTCTGTCSEMSPDSALATWSAGSKCGDGTEDTLVTAAPTVTSFGRWCGNPISLQSRTKLCPPGCQHFPPQSRVSQRLLPGFGSGEDEMTCQLC